MKESYPSINGYSINQSNMRVCKFHEVQNYDYFLQSAFVTISGRALGTETTISLIKELRGLQMRSRGNDKDISCLSIIQRL